MEAVGTAADTRGQFLQLLVAQVRHQDPLEPTKQEEFLSQLAQFSTLEGIEKLNENLDGFLHSQLENQATQNSFLAELQQFQNMTGAANLVGKQVEFETANEGSKPITTGVVQAVVIEQDAIRLRVDEALIPMDRVREISHQSEVEPAIDSIGGHSRFV